MLNCGVLRRVDFPWHLFSRVCLSELLSWALNFLFRFYSFVLYEKPKEGSQEHPGASWGARSPWKLPALRLVVVLRPKSNRQNRFATQIAISHTLPLLLKLRATQHNYNLVHGSSQFMSTLIKEIYICNLLALGPCLSPFPWISIATLLLYQNYDLDFHVIWHYMSRTGGD